VTTSRCCATDADTQRAGQSFARILRSGDIVLLTTYFGLITSSVLGLVGTLPQISKGMESIRSIGEVLQCPECGALLPSTGSTSPPQQSSNRGKEALRIIGIVSLVVLVGLAIAVFVIFLTASVRRHHL